MLNDYMGIVNLNEKEERIKELTYCRPIASIPFGGRYRLIDFVISNFVNAGIINVGVFTQNKFRSLQDHLGNGKPWDLDRKNEGLFLNLPTFNYYTLGIYRGDIDTFKNHMSYIHMGKQKNVIISPSYMVCNIDYKKAAEFFENSGADITLISSCTSKCADEFQGCYSLNIGKDNEVLDIFENNGRSEVCNIFTEMYILRKTLLEDLINTCTSRGDCDTLLEAVQKSLGKLKVNAYRFEGTVSCINSIQSYYRSNMNMFDLAYSSELFDSKGPIYTKVKDEPPVLYTETADVTNSFIANGCIIEGTVENSIIFRRVNIAKGANIKNSIIMNNCIIEADVMLRNVILDKNVTITVGKQIKGDPNYPIVVEKGAKV